MLQLRVITLLISGLLSVNALAYITPGYGPGHGGPGDGRGGFGRGDHDGRDGRGGFGRGDGEVDRICRDPANRYLDICRGYGGPSYPGTPIPDDPYSPYPPSQPYPPSNPYPGGQTDSRSAYIGRNVYSETLNLRSLAQVGPELNDALIDSVVVDIQDADYGTQLQLISPDGYLVDTRQAVGGGVVMNLPGGTRLGNFGRELQLRVSGRAYIYQVTLNFRRGDDPYNPSPIVANVRLGINRRTMGSDRIDLGQYFDAYRYQGYKIEAIDIQARAVYNQSLIDVLINSFRVGNTLNVDNYGRVYTVYPGPNAIIGRGADSIVLQTRGDMQVDTVTLRLRRR